MGEAAQIRSWRYQEAGMKRVAQFYKVSFQNFAEAVKGDFPEIPDTDIQEMYEKIMLPRRATRGSAGYDFYAPFPFVLAPGQTVKIPTGIRVRIDQDWVLKLYPRSGLGFKYRPSLSES